MNPLFAAHGSKTDLIRPSDSLEVRETLTVLFGDPGKAHIAGGQTDVQGGDVLRRHLPNGNIEHHRVDGVQIYPGGPIANIELRIAVCTAPREPQPGPGGYDLNDTWSGRDLPVLRSILHLTEQDPQSPTTTPEAIATLSEFDVRTVQLALRALESDGLLGRVSRGADDQAWMVDGVTGEGRRRAGAWPSADQVSERLTVALEQLAADAAQPLERRVAASRILDTLRDVGTGVGVTVLSAAVSRALGLA